jgi:hypothetical protein
MPYAEEEDDELAALLWMEEQANATGPQVRINTNFAGRTRTPSFPDRATHSFHVCDSCRVTLLQHRRTLQK